MGLLYGGVAGGKVLRVEDIKKWCCVLLNVSVKEKGNQPPCSSFREVRDLEDHAGHLCHVVVSLTCSKQTSRYCLMGFFRAQQKT